MTQPNKSNNDEDRMRVVDGVYRIELKLTTVDGTILGLNPYTLAVDTDERGAAVLEAFDAAKCELVRVLYGPFLGDLDD